MTPDSRERILIYFFCMAKRMSEEMAKCFARQNINGEFRDNRRNDRQGALYGSTHFPGSGLGARFGFTQSIFGLNCSRSSIGTVDAVLFPPYMLMELNDRENDEIEGEKPISNFRALLSPFSRVGCRRSLALVWSVSTRTHSQQHGTKPLLAHPLDMPFALVSLGLCEVSLFKVGNCKTKVAAATFCGDQTFSQCGL